MPVTGIETVKMNGMENNTTGKSTLGENDFLNLFVTQLKNQDPLNPMDSTDFTAQLAQFSSLEQLSNINKNLILLKGSQMMTNDRQLLGYIGKNVMASGNSIHVRNGNSNTLPFNLSSDAKVVFVNIYDGIGNLIRHSEYGAMTKGDHSVKWDGENDMGQKMPDGEYTFEVLAADEGNYMVDTATYTTGRVIGVDFKNGSSCLLTKDDKIFVDDVQKVIDSENTD